MTGPEKAKGTFAWLISAIIITLSIFTIYSNILNSPFVFDDNSDIVTNKSIRALWPPFRVLFAEAPSGTAGRPVVNLSFAVNYALGGLNPKGYHIFDLSFFCLGAILLYSICQRLFSNPRLGGLSPDRARIVALFSALLWGLHPLNTSAVSLSFHRPEIMCGFFCLVTVYTSLLGFESTRPWRWHIPAILSFILAVGSKETAVAAPFFIFALHWVLSPKVPASHFFRRNVFLSYGFLFGFLLLVALVTTSGAFGRVSAKGGFSPFEYALSQGTCILKYLRLFFFPFGLCADRFETLPHLSQSLPAAALVLAAIAASANALHKRRPWALVPAWIFLFLAPSSSFVPLLRLCAEHRMMMPLMALCPAFVFLVEWYLARLLAKYGWVKFNASTIILLTVLAVFLGTISRKANRIYESGVSFWNDVSMKSPYNSLAWMSLGFALNEAGRIGDAEAAYLRALSLEPDNPMMHNNLGALYYQTGRFPDAIRHFSEMLRLAPENAIAHNGLGLVLLKTGRIGKAVYHLRKAVFLDPKNKMMRLTLADALYRASKTDEAIVSFREVLRIAPNDERAIQMYGSVLVSSGRADEVLALLLDASVRYPQNPQIALVTGRAFLDSGQPIAAIPYFRRAASLAPDFAAAHYYWGEAKRLSGSSYEAISHYRRAIEIDPSYGMARINLAEALTETGQTDEAIKEIDKAIGINPQDEKLAEIKKMILNKEPGSKQRNMKP